MLLDNKKPTMSNNNIFLSITILLSWVILATYGEDCHGGGDGAIKLTLLHRHHPKILERLDIGLNAEDMNERVREIHEHDTMRHRKLSELLDRKLGETRVQGLTNMKAVRPNGTGIGLKMYPGAEVGISEYFAELKVGSPPQDMVVIVDTGSDLTWFKCRYRRCVGNCSNGTAVHKIRNERRVKFDRVFNANRSSSFVPIPCGTNECDEFASLFAQECDNPAQFCRYDYSYTGGEIARGLFALETLTVNLTDGTEKKMNNSLIGCTESLSTTTELFKGSDGLIGLGSYMYSFTYKAAQSSHGGGFSYCLMDHLLDRTATSYFVLGSPDLFRNATTSAALTNKTTVIQLLRNEEFHGLYGVNLVDISVDGVTLEIPSRVWDPAAGGGTIIDSGSSLTFLTTAAYRMLFGALIPKFHEYEMGRVGPFEYCFNDTSYRDSTLRPKIRFHFGDGAVFEPPTKNYIVPVVSQTSCFAFVPTPFPGTNILGNILQQNHLWEFDFHKGTVSFTPSECI